eukprot:6134525-Pyramimonas_sp.AAC.1
MLRGGFAASACHEGVPCGSGGNAGPSGVQIARGGSPRLRPGNIAVPAPTQIDTCHNYGVLVRFIRAGIPRARWTR